MRVVVRFYAGDRQFYRYCADDVAELDDRGSHAAPVCQDGRFYPWRHDPELIGTTDLPEPGRIDGCPAEPVVNAV